MTMSTAERPRTVGRRQDAILLDCDVVVGGWPRRPDLDYSPGGLREQNVRHGVGSALVCSGRGAWFNDVEGNAETVQMAAAAACLPSATIDLRNALPAERIAEQAVRDGVKALRLFPTVQGCGPTFPGLGHVLRVATGHDLVVLLEGDVREFGPACRGLGATVVFLDVHAYHVADFVLLARDEPGFMCSTRLLNAPDSIETVAGEVGADRLCFGSRSPLHDRAPAVLRMRNARLSDTEWTSAAGGALRERVDA